MKAELRKLRLMGLVMYWYDIVCVGIVGVSVVGAIVVIIRNEGQGRGRGRGISDETRNKGRSSSSYETLLLPATPTPTPTPSSSSSPSPTTSKLGFVSAMSLWISCWRCVHPALLACYRFLAFLIMLLLLLWDIHDWTLGIYSYYTDVTSCVLWIVKAHTIFNLRVLYGCLKRQGRRALDWRPYIPC